MPREHWKEIKFTGNQKYTILGVGNYLSPLPGFPRAEQLVLTPFDTMDGRWAMLNITEGYEAIRNGKIRATLWLRNYLQRCSAGVAIRVAGATWADMSGYVALIEPLVIVGKPTTYCLSLYKLPVAGVSAKNSPSEFPDPLARISIQPSLTFSDVDIPVFVIELEAINNDLGKAELRVYQERIGANISLIDFLQKYSINTERSTALLSQQSVIESFISTLQSFSIEKIPSMFSTAGVDFTEAWNELLFYEDINALEPGYAGISSPAYCYPTLSTAFGLNARLEIQNGAAYLILRNTIYPTYLGANPTDILKNALVKIHGSIAIPTNNGFYRIVSVSDEGSYENNKFQLDSDYVWGSSPDDIVNQDPVNADIMGNWLVGFDNIKIFRALAEAEMVGEYDWFESFEDDDHWFETFEMYPFEWFESFES